MGDSTLIGFFRMRPAQMIAGLLIILAFVIFLLVSPVVNVPDGFFTKVFLVVELSVLLLLSRLSTLTKVGVGFANLTLTGVMLTFGVWVALGMIWVTTLIYIYMATRPTAIDFAIKKGVGGAVCQCIYLSLWAGTIIFVYNAFGLAYIMDNLVFVYMISVAVYVVYMMICMPIFMQTPIPMVLIDGMLTVVVQFIIIKYLGHTFMVYMLGFV